MEPSLGAAPPKSPSLFWTEYYPAVFLFLLAGVVALAFFVIRPQILQIRSVNAETESLIQTIGQERAYLASLDQSIAAAQTISPGTLEEVSQALPNEINIPSLLAQLGVAAGKSNVRIMNMNVLETRAQSGVQARSATSTQATATPIDINVSLQARNYFDVKRFLTELEANLRIMDVVTISLNVVGTELNYSIQIRTYTFTPAVRSGAAPSSSEPT